MKRRIRFFLITALLLCWAFCSQALAQEVYTITPVNDEQAEVTIFGTADAAVMEEIRAACGSKTISCIRIEKGGVLSAGGSFDGVKVYNAGTISGAFDLYDVVNDATGVISGSYERDEGYYYFDSTIHGEIENYGSISYVDYANTASVKLNEGSLKVACRWNSSWEWDEGAGWGYTEVLLEYRKTVSEELGEGGWYTPHGEFANSRLIDLTYQEFYRQWQVSDGVMTVKGCTGFSSDPAIVLTGDMLEGVSKIIVSMGQIKVDSTSADIELRNTTCEDEVYCYISGLKGGTYSGTITVSGVAQIDGCTLNGDLILNTHCKVTNTTFGKKAKTILTGTLGECKNIWKPSGFPYTYDMDLTVAEGGSIQNGTFNGAVTNYGSITDGTFNGDCWDMSANAHAADGSASGQS